MNLQKFCTDLISKEPNKIFMLLDFVSIPENPLFLSFKMTASKLDVLKWVLAQNPELSSDPTDECFEAAMYSIN